MTQLALFGGTPARAEAVPLNITTGIEEYDAVRRVLETGRLSLFEGSPQPDPPFSFLGGPQVQELEKAWCEFYGTRFAVAMNSATSGLYASVGALGLGPGDEVIVSPYTMSASAACVLGYNAIPVFADINDDDFGFDPKSVEQKITPRTKAIIVIHLFGHPAKMKELLDLARKHNLKVVEDCAQAHDATYHGRQVGTLGDIGIFSLNCNKTIQTGEGGVVVTDDEELALRLRLIRNHAEAVVGGMGYTNIVNMLGWNYRMTELEAAIGRVQLKKLPELNRQRREMAAYLSEKLNGFPGIITPKIADDCSHSFYVYPIRYNGVETGVPRKVIARALVAEGTPFYEGYTKPLYLAPLYQQKTVYGTQGCPFSCAYYKGSINYNQGICPTAERLYSLEMLVSDMVRPPLSIQSVDEIVTAFRKIYDHMPALREIGQAEEIKGNQW